MDGTKKAFTCGFGAVALISAVGLLLSACDEHPYPPTAQAAPPAAAPPALLGAPDNAPPPPAPPAYAPPPPPAYEAGAVVAMAPIPNPGDPGSASYYGPPAHGRRIHARYPGSTVAENTAVSPYGGLGHAAHGEASSPSSAAPAPEAEPSISPQTASPQTKVAPTPKHALTGAAAAAGAAALLAKPSPHAAPAYPSTPAPTGQGSDAGDHAANLVKLQTALTDVVAKTAVLTAPSTFVLHQPADVALTLPPGFADSVHQAAKTANLADAATAANVTALLAGDGFSVTPDDTQSTAMTVGQATQFHWSVTPQSAAHGTLHADVGADLLGAGSDKLALGSIKPSQGLAPRTLKALGVAILVLIAALIAGWIARSQGPSRSLAARRASRQALRDAPPLDMGRPPGTDKRD